MLESLIIAGVALAGGAALAAARSLRRPDPSLVARMAAELGLALRAPGLAEGDVDGVQVRVEARPGWVPATVVRARLPRPVPAPEALRRHADIAPRLLAMDTLDRALGREEVAVVVPEGDELGARVRQLAALARALTEAWEAPWRAAAARLGLARDGRSLAGAWRGHPVDVVELDFPGREVVAVSVTVALPRPLPRGTRLTQGEDLVGDLILDGRVGVATSDWAAREEVRRRIITDDARGPLLVWLHERRGEVRADAVMCRPAGPLDVDALEGVLVDAVTLARALG